LIGEACLRKVAWGSLIGGACVLKLALGSLQLRDKAAMETYRRIDKRAGDRKIARAMAIDYEYQCVCNLSAHAHTHTTISCVKKSSGEGSLFLNATLFRKASLEKLLIFCCEPAMKSSSSGALLF
jgi:hypothetical protein